MDVGRQDNRDGEQPNDEELEDQGDVEERASAERLYAKIDARAKIQAFAGVSRDGRVHEVAKGDAVHAAFTIAASDFRDVMKATRLRGSGTLREMRIVGSDLCVTASSGDVRFSFNAPISDVYIKSGETTSDRFVILARLDSGAKAKSLAKEDEQLYFVLKLGQRYAEIYWHAAPPIQMRRGGRSTQKARKREIELDADRVLRPRARPVRAPSLAAGKRSEIGTFNPRRLSDLMGHAAAVLKGATKKVLDDSMTRLTVQNGQIVALRPGSVCVVSSPSLDGLDCALNPNDGVAIARVLRRCRGTLRLDRGNGHLYGACEAAEVSFREMPHGSPVGDLVSRAGSPLASATFAVGAVLERVWRINSLIVPKEKPGELYLNIGLESHVLKLHAESSRGQPLSSAHLSVPVESFLKSVEGDEYRPNRSIDGRVFERFLQSLTEQRAEMVFLEQDSIAISATTDLGQGRVIAYLHTSDGKVVLH